MTLGWGLILPSLPAWWRRCPRKATTQRGGLASRTDSCSVSPRFDPWPRYEGSRNGTHQPETGDN